MGYMPEEEIVPAGNFVLATLVKLRTIRYSHFMDGRDETHNAVRAAIRTENLWALDFSSHSASHGE